MHIFFNSNIIWNQSHFFQNSLYFSRNSAIAFALFWRISSRTQCFFQWLVEFSYYCPFLFIPLHSVGLSLLLCCRQMTSVIKSKVNIVLSSFVVYGRCANPPRPRHRRPTTPPDSWGVKSQLITEMVMIIEALYLFICVLAFSTECNLASIV